MKLFINCAKTPLLAGFLQEAYQGAILYTMERRIEVVLGNLDQIPEHNGDLLNYLNSEQIDGVIFDYTLSPESTLKLLDYAIPAVNLCSANFSDQFTTVLQDNHEFGRVGARYFLERSFEQVAFFGVEFEECSVSPPREAGFREIFTGHSGLCPSFMTFLNRSMYDSYLIGEKILADVPAFYDWLQALPKPVGVMCYHDGLAYILQRACQKLGFKVPDDVAILGVQEFPLPADIPGLNLSSIDHNARACGAAAVKQMVKILESGKDLLEQIYIPPKGVVTRKSTDIYHLSDLLVKKGLQYIQNNFATQVTSEEMANALECSYPTLRRRFLKALGCTPAEELRNRRLVRAKQLLIDSSLTLKEIAFLTGFTDASHLVNQFKKVTGVTPREWRGYEV